MVLLLWLLDYIDTFDKRFFDSLGGFSAHMGQGGCIVYNNQVGRHCCWLDTGDWWIFCRTFLLLEIPIEQSMEGFLGWVTGMVANLLDWFVGVWSSIVDEGGLHLQVMDFASVLMHFLLVCGGSGVLPLHLADRYWPSYRSLMVRSTMLGWRRGCIVTFPHKCFALAIICA